MSWRWRLLTLATTVIAAVLIVGPATIWTPWTVAGEGLDLPGTIWIHWWVGQQSAALTFPVHTDLLFYPDGKNFLADTGANYLDAWIGWPLQWLVGVPDFLDLLDVVVLVGNALAMYALASDVLERKNPAAAWAVAMAFLLNPYATQQIAQGRPTQALLWFGVLAARHLLRIEEGWRQAVWFGLHVALQALTYWFTPYFLALGLLPLALVLALRSPRVVLPRLALAIAVTLLVTSPFLIGVYQALRDGEVSRTDFGSWEDSPAAQPIRWHLILDQLHSATALAMFGLALYGGRRALPLLVGAGLVTLFSFGGRMDIVLPPIDNPLFIWMWKTLPLIPRLGFPDRAAMGTWILLPAAALYGIRRLDPKYALLFGLLAIGEGFWRNTWPVGSTTYTVPAMAQHIRADPGPLIHLPFAAADNNMVIQTVHGQPLFGGMGEREEDMRPPGFQARYDNGFYTMLAGTINDREGPIGYTWEERLAITSVFRWLWLDRTISPYFWQEIGYDPDLKARQLVKELGAPVLADADGYLWDLRRPPPPEPPGTDPRAARRGGEIERLSNGQLVTETPGSMLRSGPPQVGR